MRRARVEEVDDTEERERAAARLEREIEQMEAELRKLSASVETAMADWRAMEKKLAAKKMLLKRLID